MTRDEAIAEFGGAVAGEPRAVRLDRAALLIAACAQPDLDVEAELARLDALGERVKPPTLDGLVALLFRLEGFRGDTDSYDDPRNSYLNLVLDRRRGLPITLAVLAIEVGRRAGVPVAGVSMPGHFLLRDRVDPNVLIDPFSRGALLDPAMARQIFHRIQGPGAVFDDRFLDPVSAPDILGRMLANLRSSFVRRGRRHSLVWLERLAASFPGAGAAEHERLAAALAAAGRFDRAADAYAGLGSDEGERRARQLRARLN